MIESKENSWPILAVAGPTASGKSALGIELALRFNGEIINCDSVQVYREIEIATAKVPLEERRGVAHHLIDFVSPEVNYTAGQWARAAAEKIGEIEARGRMAIIVGGTGFYLRALRQPLFQSQKTDEPLRRRLAEIKERRGAYHLYRLLQRLDAASAAKIQARDYVRVIRALEVRLQTGASITEQRQTAIVPPSSLAARLLIIALNPPRAELYDRINHRAEFHFAAGLVCEVKQLLERGVPRATNALGAHGYRRVVEYLHDERSLESAIEQTKLDVRHYAKRQMTWFRREPVALWLDGFGDEKAVQAKAIRFVDALFEKSSGWEERETECE
ncbi:MAG: tRNA (adenosine(37)-N6)-dimethylallyltransferase MiaA [Pyrinomonadaceae bacterium]|nr:tRNA (adenosine(37)-N6)-dimethylallyltransferase MiaA [Pyrinomonadaceae bacterium]